MAKRVSMSMFEALELFTNDPEYRAEMEEIVELVKAGKWKDGEDAAEFVIKSTTPRQRMIRKQLAHARLYGSTSSEIQRSLPPKK